MVVALATSDACKLGGGVQLKRLREILTKKKEDSIEIEDSKLDINLI
jgi:hypothetical protein